MLRVSGTPQRSATRPRAERRTPRSAAVVCERYYQDRAAPETPRSFRRSGRPSEAPRRGPRASEAAALWAARARRPRTPRAGRGRGGRSAPAAPPRPGPEWNHRPPEPRAGSHLRPPSRPGPKPRRALTQGLRPDAYSATSASAPAEPSRRPACGVWRAAGAEPAPGTALIAPTGGGVTPRKIERAYWAGVLGRGPTPHGAFWLVGSDVGWSLSRGPGAARCASLGRPGANTRGRLLGLLGT